MQELLNNPVIQTALVAVIAAALNALVAMIKQRFPTQADLVEKNWCYLQPAVAAALDKARAAAQSGDRSSVTLSNIIARSLIEFSDQYGTFEGHVPSDQELSAARAELAAAVKKIME